MSSAFDIREHTLDGQHIREYFRATPHSQEEVVRIAIKQYIPKDNQNPKPGDVTIIGAHANGFPKELYEALWEELYARSKENGFRIRSIWIADASHQGASGVLNEGHLGNDPGWYDHSRDLLHMINHFRNEMPMPLVGIGHSMGGGQLANLSFMHPRLFSTLVLLDPVIQENRPTGQSLKTIMNTGYFPARMSTYRRDIWPSRTEAAQGFLKTPYYKSWDSRVFDAWVQNGLRDTPTALYPDETGKVTLTTTKHNEIMSFLRPVEIPDEESPDVGPENLKYAKEAPFYRNEISELFHRLPFLRPTTLFIFGETSPMSTPQLQDQKMSMVGTGVGGSGGAKAGRVQKTVLKGIGHLVAMEAPQLCADAAAPWIGEQIKRHEEQMEVYRKWTQKSDFEKMTTLPGWNEKIGPPLSKGKPPVKPKI